MLEMDFLKIIFYVYIGPNDLKIEKQLGFDVLKVFARSYSTCEQCAREKNSLSTHKILSPKNPAEFSF